MIAPFNLRGYVASDPLDRVPRWFARALAAVVTFAVCVGFLHVVFDVLRIATLRYTWLFWLECAVVAVAYSPVVAALRKASSVVPVALLAVTMVPLDIVLEARVRMTGGEAPWSYPAESILGGLSPLLRIAVVWTVDGVMMGPVALWLTRLLALPVARGLKSLLPTFDYPLVRATPTPLEHARLFPAEWTSEGVTKPGMRDHASAPSASRARASCSASSRFASVSMDRAARAPCMGTPTLRFATH